MEDFFTALSKGLKGLANSPVLLMAGILVGILTVPGLLAYGKFDELVVALSANYMILFPLLVMPFITGGALSYAIEVSKVGASSLSTFLAGAKKYYMRLLLAGIAAYILFHFLGLSVLVVMLGSGMAGDALLTLLLTLVSVVFMFIVLMMIEFYDVIIVSGNTGIVQSFRGSVSFVKSNFMLVLPFFVIIILVKLLIQFPLIAGMTAEMATNETYLQSYMDVNQSLNTSLVNPVPINMGSVTLISVAIFQSVVQGFVFAFVMLYKVEFYRMVSGRKKITDFDYDFSRDGST